MKQRYLLSLESHQTAIGSGSEGAKGKEAISIDGSSCLISDTQQALLKAGIALSFSDRKCSEGMPYEQ